jgi:ABC-type glycerol-3-phosphate transport system permease component
MSTVTTPVGQLRRRTVRTGALALVLGKERGLPGAKVAVRLMLSVFCLVAGVIYLIPLLWVLSLSVRSTGDVFNASLWPHEWIFGNYVKAWDQYSLGLLFVHSLIVTGVTTIATIAFSVTAAYGLAGARSRGAYLTTGLLLAGLMVPAAVIIVPFFLLVHQLGLYNSLFGVVLAEIAFALPLAVIILRGYVETIPKGLIDSARVDGASEWVAFRRIVLPLLRPAIATVAIFTIISTWNDFLLPLVLLANTNSSTLTVGMSQFAGEFGSLSWQLTGAASTMAMIPLIFVFFIGRRYYVRGLTAGALRE